MNRLNEPKFNGFIGQQSVTPLSVAFWWCGAGKRSDFGSSDPIKFRGSTWALFLVDHVHAEGLESATDVEAGAAADFDSGHDFGVGVVFVGEEQDASPFDGADIGFAFSGEVLELAALFFGQSYLVRFFWQATAYSLARRCTQDISRLKVFEIARKRIAPEGTPMRLRIQRDQKTLEITVVRERNTSVTSGHGCSRRALD